MAMSVIKSDMNRELSQNLSGDEVYHMNSLILLVENMLCSKLDFQKDFNLTLFSSNILRGMSRPIRLLFSPGSCCACWPRTPKSPLNPKVDDTASHYFNPKVDDTSTN